MSGVSQFLRALLCAIGGHQRGPWQIKDAAFASGIEYEAKCRCGSQTYSEFRRCGPIYTEAAHGVAGVSPEARQQGNGGQ